MRWIVFFAICCLKVIPRTCLWPASIQFKEVYPVTVNFLAPNYCGVFSTQCLAFTDFFLSGRF